MRIKLFIVSLIVFTSCIREKNCDGNHTDVDIHPKLLEYIGVFKNTGNWWIYENTGRTEKDSIYIENSVISRNIPRQEPCFAFQYMKGKVKSNLQGAGIFYYAFHHDEYKGTRHVFVIK